MNNDLKINLKNLILSFKKSIGFILEINKDILHNLNENIVHKLLKSILEIYHIILFFEIYSEYNIKFWDTYEIDKENSFEIQINNIIDMENEIKEILNQNNNHFNEKIKKLANIFIDDLFKKALINENIINAKNITLEDKKLFKLPTILEENHMAIKCDKYVITIQTNKY